MLLKKIIKPLKITYLIFVVLLTIAMLFVVPSFSASSKDILIDRLSTFCFYAISFVLPAVFILSQSIRKKIPLFKKEKLISTILGWSLLFVIGMIVYGGIDSFHSVEYNVEKSKYDAVIEAKKIEANKIKAQAKAKEEAEAKAKEDAKAKEIADAKKVAKDKAKADADAKAKADAEVQAKAIADAKAKADADAKAKAVADAKIKAEADAKAKATAAAAAAKAKADITLTNDEITHFISAAQFYVKYGLKSPSSADFPGQILELDQWRVTKRKNIVEVSSYVDSQNSFGAMLRSQFTVQINYTTSECTYLNINGQRLSGTYQNLTK